MSAIHITALRSNIYQIIDSVLKTGVPVEIERHGKKLKLVPVEDMKKRGSVFDVLPKRRHVTTGNDNDFAHIDWSGEWKA